MAVDAQFQDDERVVGIPPRPVPPLDKNIVPRRIRRAPEARELEAGPPAAGRSPGSATLGPA